MELTSSAFADGEPIPSRHTCDGDDVSPPLAWTGTPAGAVALALCLDDPDAGRYPFTHWLAWGLALEGALGEGEAAPGKAHRYVFALYALDAEPELGPGDRRLSFDKAVDGHVLATAQLIGSYER